MTQNTLGDGTGGSNLLRDREQGVVALFAAFLEPSRFLCGAQDVKLQLLQVKLDGRWTWIVADFVAQHSDVAAERRGSDRVIGLAPADSRDTRRITNRETQHAHAEPLRYYEMAGFMDD